MALTRTQLISKQQALLRETKQKLSYTLSYMEQAMRKLVQLSDEIDRQEGHSKQSSSETLQLSQILENEYLKLLKEGGLEGWTGEEYKCVVAMQRLIPYFKAREL